MRVRTGYVCFYIYALVREPLDGSQGQRYQAQWAGRGRNGHAQGLQCSTNLGYSCAPGVERGGKAAKEQAQGQERLHVRHAQCSGLSTMRIQDEGQAIVWQKVGD